MVALAFRPRPPCDAPSVRDLLQTYRQDWIALANPLSILLEGEVRWDHDISAISRNIDMLAQSQCYFRVNDAVLLAEGIEIVRPICTCRSALP